MVTAVVVAVLTKGVGDEGVDVDCVVGGQEEEAGTVADCGVKASLGMGGAGVSGCVESCKINTSSAYYGDCTERTLGSSIAGSCSFVAIMMILELCSPPSAVSMMLWMKHSFAREKRVKMPDNISTRPAGRQDGRAGPSCTPAHGLQQ